MSRVGHEFAEISHRPDLPWTFTALDSPVVNAFAVPGEDLALLNRIDPDQALSAGRRVKLISLGRR